MIAPLALALALALVCGRCAAHPLDAGGGGAAGGAWRSSWRLKADDGSAGAGPAMEPALLAKIEGKRGWATDGVAVKLRGCRVLDFEDIGFYATAKELAEECKIKLTHANALKA